MGKVLKNMAELEKYVNKIMRDVMVNEVAEKVRDVQQDKIQSVVYDSYQNPNTERRHENDGLMDRNNMYAEANIKGEGVELFVKNLTDGNPNVDYTTFTEAPNYLAGIIEYGREPSRKGLYAYNKDGTEGDFLKPRPFIAETHKHLLKTNEHIHAMKKGLGRLGIKFM